PPATPRPNVPEPCGSPTRADPAPSGRQPAPTAKAPTLPPAAPPPPGRPCEARDGSAPTGSQTSLHLFFYTCSQRPPGIQATPLRPPGLREPNNQTEGTPHPIP